MDTEDQDLLVELMKNEIALLDPITRKNPENLFHLLGTSFFEIGCSGKVWQRPDAIKGLCSSIAPNINATDFSLHRITSEVALLTFKTTKIDENGNSSLVLRSSIWKKNETGWQMIFHQGTKTSSSY